MVTTTTTKGSSIRLVAFASLIGTTIEWYDFFLYGTAAALVFNRLFFPTFDARVGTLAAFATYSVGFFARPFGAIIIGHYGDRIGRKSMLILTLILMGAATFSIGLMPTYRQIGPWAAVALVMLRLIQGFGVGGEWGGAVLMAVEHAPAGARGFYGSWVQIGVPAGLLLSTAVFAQFARLPEEQFLSWGWRVPFLVSILLVGVGLIIRVRILETPAFARVKQARTEARRPIVEVLPDRLGRRPVYLFGACVTALYAYPLFRLLDTGSTPLVWLALVVALVFAHSPMYGPQAAFLSELFNTRVRYSGASLGSQLSSVIAGGLSPFIATALLPYGRVALAAYIIVMALVTIVAVLIASETSHQTIG